MNDKPAEYTELIEAIAEEIVDSDPDSDRDRLIHEAADGSEWTFKDFKARQIVAGEDMAHDGEGTQLNAVAYRVMRRDIEQAIARIEEERKPVEHEFTVVVDLEYTIKVSARAYERFMAPSIEEAKSQADGVIALLVSGDTWRAVVPGGYELQGATLESVEENLVCLSDNDTSEDYDSLAIESGDDKPFFEED